MDERSRGDRPKGVSVSESRGGRGLKDSAEGTGKGECQVCHRGQI